MSSQIMVFTILTFIMGSYVNNTEELNKKFEEYAINAQIYLDRPTFNNTPITGQLLAECARIAYDSTGIVVPLDLALSQAQWESSMGRRGLSAKNNPYNVGEWDGKTTRKFTSTKEGVLAYYMLMVKNYLNHKNVDELLVSFTNNNGHRYASNPHYEKNLKVTQSFINRWIVKTQNKYD